MLDRASRKAWVQSDITKEVFKELQRRQQAMAINFLMGSSLDSISSEKTALETARIAGAYLELDYLINVYGREEENERDEPKWDNAG